MMFLASSIRAMSRRVDGLDLSLGRIDVSNQVQENEDDTEERERENDDQLMRRILALDERVAKVTLVNDNPVKIQNDEDIILPLKI